jgi:hypothetical protein
MSRNRKPARKKNKPPLKAQEIVAPKSRIRARLVAWGLGIATVVGSTGILFLQPRPSVNPPGPPDLTNPFNASFTITNTNIIPLRDVGVSIGVIQVVMSPLPFNETKRPPLYYPGRLPTITREDWNNHNLEMDEKYTITPDVIAPGRGASLGGADVAIVVKYRPWFLPVERRRIFRFVTHNNGDGTFSWHSYPLR